MDLVARQYDGVTDMELVNRVLAGDALAAVCLVAGRCGPGLKFLAQVKYASLGMELDDLISEVFIRLQENNWQALQDFRGSTHDGRSCSPVTYVLCIAARMLWKRMDKSVKENTWLMPLHEMDGLAYSPEGANRQRIAAEVIEAIMTLRNPADRLALMLYKVDGLDVEEVARIMKTTPSNVHTRCSRAVKALREKLSLEESNA